MKAIRDITLSLFLALSAVLAQGADQSRSPVTAEPPGKSIPFDQLAAEAQKLYAGDGIALTPTADGATLRTGFQKLEGTVTSEGLRLSSTETEGGSLELTASAVGRVNREVQVLSSTGVVTSTSALVSFTRPGLTEEYSVSVDGVRQDFIVAAAPKGNGALSVELALNGATAEVAAKGAKLTLADSGRVLAYSRLKVTDARGQVLAATLSVLSPTHLAVQVQDAQAVYPIRIDPTFSDADWESMNPGMFGADSYVHSAVVDGSGNLYIGGYFGFVGSVVANHVAKWNGSTWSALGSGTDGDVRALVVSGGNLYAGGSFTTAGGTPANNVAKWDGSAWSALGTGASDVYALAASGSDLYAGGHLGTTSYVTKWNGTNWSALGTGMNGDVYALVISGSDLYAGGYFTTASYGTVNHIARWDGSAWWSVGTGMDNTVWALATDGNNIYAGGYFTTAGGTAARNIAKWNGTAWSALGSGLNGTVHSLAVMGNDLYASGWFGGSGSTTVNYIAKWSGSTWSALGTGMDISVNALAVNGNELYAGGDFITAGGKNVNYIAKWSGDAWSALGSGMDGQVRALAVSGSDLYMGGDFTTVAGMAANYIAKWNGSAWSTVGTGMDRPVYGLAVSGSDLYAGGGFSTAGGTAAKGVAKWDGSAWSALGLGVDSGVVTLAVSGSNLYVGGSFTTAGGIAANDIAKWDGSAWSALGSGLKGSPNIVYALAVSGSNVYAGGWFDTAGGTSAKSIAKWNGSTWSALSTGLTGNNSHVSALAVIGSDLYAGGWFNTAGGTAAKNIAKWNGSAWSVVSSGLNGTVNVLAASGSDLYAGGEFNMAGSTEASGIAKWNGSTWSALGSGTGAVNALAVAASDHLYVGGSFNIAGTTVSPYIVEIGSPPPAPTVTSISPASGTVAGDSSVTITGTGFRRISSVTFGGMAAAFTVVSATSITAITPVHEAGTVSVLVTNRSGSNGANTLYTYVPPTVTSVSPGSGTAAGGTSVTITGTGLAQISSVTFGGTAATFTVVSDTSITAITPAHEAGPVSVLGTNRGGSNAANTLYTYVLVPPVVVTSAATNIDFDLTGVGANIARATLNATVDAKGSARQVFFDYGLTTSYGTTVAASPSTLSENGARAVTAVLTGLLPHKLYYYRARATGAIGNATGSGMLFVTPNHVPVAVADNAFALFSNVVTIDVLGNDKDDDGDRLMLTAVKSPAATAGTVKIVDGKVVFTTAATFVGTSFTYTISDGFGGTATGIVNIALADCGLSPATAPVAAAATNYPVTVTTTGSWKVTEALAWATVSPTSGTGDGSVTVTLLANTTKTSRSGVITIGGKAHTIIQAGTQGFTIGQPESVPAAMVSADYSLTIPALMPPVTFTSSLPSGLVINKTTGMISGKPKVAGTFKVSITGTTTTGAATTLVVPITIQPLPVGAIGSFSGPIAKAGLPADNSNLGGRFDVNTTAAGTLTGKIIIGAKTYTLPLTAVLQSTVGSAFATASFTIPTPLPALTVGFTVDSASNALTHGDIFDGTNHTSFQAWRNVWTTPGLSVADQANMNRYLGLHTFALKVPAGQPSLPQGSGYGCFTVAAKTGALSAAGKLADGTGFACSTFAGPNGEVLLYQALYGSKGSIIGSMDIATGSAGVVPPYGDNSLMGTVSWRRPAIAGRLYASGFEPCDLTAVGGRYVPPVSPKLALGITDDLVHNNGTLAFSGADILNVSPNIAFRLKAGSLLVPLAAAGNTRKTGLTITAGSGYFTGGFSLSDPNAIVGTALRPALYYGQIVRDTDGALRGFGYFLLADSPAMAGQTVLNTRQQSGQVVLEKNP